MEERASNSPYSNAMETRVVPMNSPDRQLSNGTACRNRRTCLGYVGYVVNYIRIFIIPHPTTLKQ